MLMPSPRDLAIARIRAANNSRQTTPRATTAPAKLPTAPAGPKPRPLHRYGEKRTLAVVVGFIAALVAAGIIYSYSSMSTGPPEKPVKETALQVPAPTRIARILLPGTGPLCREILFDNDTGFFSLERAAACDSAPPAQARSGGSGGGGGFSSFKEAFGRKS